MLRSTTMPPTWLDHHLAQRAAVAGGGTGVSPTSPTTPALYLSKDQIRYLILKSWKAGGRKGSWGHGGIVSAAPPWAKRGISYLSPSTCSFLRLAVFCTLAPGQAPAEALAFARTRDACTRKGLAS